MGFSFFFENTSMTNIPINNGSPFNTLKVELTRWFIDGTIIDYTLLFV